MRSRSNSGVRLDYYSHLLTKTVLSHANPYTGLLPSQSAEFSNHAWVRDNVYAVHSIWGMSLAFKKRADYDEERRKVYELEQTCVRIMRSLLRCMMHQLDKVEKFKHSQAPGDALHAKYRVDNWGLACADSQWGHLQIDATSLYLLTLAQQTAAGIQIIYTLDEVAFIQNLVFYIEAAYRIPDYGMWERGDKTNHGLPELNASSIGMAKAALEALNDLDLFGAHGSAASVIHVMADELQQCHAVLESMLPRESNSKEVDAGLLSVISYPAFAVDSDEIIAATRDKIRNNLQGRYGCSRFLRDGYLTALEDPSRLYYEPFELQQFEGIECQWPLFFCFLVLDAIFTGDTERTKEYREMLEATIVKSDEGVKKVPELYTVPSDWVQAEKENPGSQERKAAGAVPFNWAQSLYILGCLLDEKFIQVAELDPLNRRLSHERKPDTVVQVVVLAESQEVKTHLAREGIHVNTVSEVRPYIIQPASVLGTLYTQLGRNRKMNLTGRPSKDVGLLSTSKLYMIDDHIFAFTPQFMDWGRFYSTYDLNILLDMMRSELFYVSQTWSIPGRPLIVMTLNASTLSNLRDEDLEGPEPAEYHGDRKVSAVHHLHSPLLNRPQNGKLVPSGIIGALKKLKAGYLHGTRVQMGRIDDFLTTSAMVRLNFLESTAQAEDPATFFDRPHPRQPAQPLERPFGASSRAGSTSTHGDVGPPRSRSGLAPPTLRVTRGSIDATGIGLGLLDVMRNRMDSHSDIPEGIATSRCSTALLDSEDLEPDVRDYLVNVLTRFDGSLQNKLALPAVSAKPSLRRKISSKRQKINTLTQRRRTIVLQADDEDLQRLRLRTQHSAATMAGDQMYRSPTRSSETTPTVTPVSTPDRRDSASISSDRRDSSVSNQSGTPQPPSPLLGPDLVNALVDANSDGQEAKKLLADLKSLDNSSEEELLELLKESDTLEDQADVVHFLWIKNGPEYDTFLDGPGTTVRKLFEEIYEKACRAQIWWLVRHSAGLLQKRVDDVAKAVTDLLVRQKSVTVGMPAIHEEAINRPLPPDELQRVISKCFGTDSSSAILTHELLLYLGMFVRTESGLFSEMLRLRVGLIIQVMASELARALSCSGDEASEQLMNLSPFEMKTLLHHILSGKEFSGLGEPLTEPSTPVPATDAHDPFSPTFKRAHARGHTSFGHHLLLDQHVTRREKSGMLSFRRVLDRQNAKSMPQDSLGQVESDSEEDEDATTGQWLRRRRIDGALNRVPSGFYGKIWNVLQKCEALAIEGYVLHSNITKEMTRQELKFALTVESALNKVLEPEYRQLMVEAMMVLTMVAENQVTMSLRPDTINVRDIVHTANRIFVSDQREQEGDSMLCCGRSPPEPCEGVAGICRHFYDSPPSGRFGTLTYMCRAVVEILHQTNDNIDCTVS